MTEKYTHELFKQSFEINSASCHVFKMQKLEKLKKSALFEILLQLSKKLIFRRIYDDHHGPESKLALCGHAVAPDLTSASVVWSRFLSF